MNTPSLILQLRQAGLFFKQIDDQLVLTPANCLNDTYRQCIRANKHGILALLRTGFVGTKAWSMINDACQKLPIIPIDVATDFLSAEDIVDLEFGLLPTAALRTGIISWLRCTRWSPEIEALVQPHEVEYAKA